MVIVVVVVLQGTFLQTLVFVNTKPQSGVPSSDALLQFGQQGANESGSAGSVPLHRYTSTAVPVPQVTEHAYES